MSEAIGDGGIAFVCDADGLVERVICPDRDVLEATALGSPLYEIVPPTYVEGVKRFFAQLTNQRVVFDWEVAPPPGDTARPLNFSGVRLGDCSVVIASFDRSEVSRVTEELVHINNEQTNALRSANRTIAVQTRGGPADEDHVYGELTRVNNELVGLQRALTKANARLETLNRRKNEMLGMAAHDMRSPLGIILTYSEFIETEAAQVLTGEQMEFVDTIRRSSEFMLKVINDLLDVSSIESGQLRLDSRTGDLVGLVRENVIRNRALARNKGVDIHLHLPEAPVALRFDAEKIEQVLNNLLDNAIKFSHPGGGIHVGVAGGEDPVMVSVSDEGVGITADRLDNLFKPYGTGKTPGTQGEKSTGLGLAIVKRIIEGHGGTVQVRSERGQGTTFSFSLPLTTHE